MITASSMKIAPPDPAARLVKIDLPIGRADADSGKCVTELSL